MKNIIKKLPIPAAGLMLSLGSVGNLISSYGNIYKQIFGIIAFIFFILLSIKIFTYPKDIIEKLKNPVVASVAPTFSMGIMVISTYLKPLSSSIAYLLYIIGILIHVGLIIYFTKEFIFNFNINKVFPSYFVVYVGIVVASVVAPAFKTYTLGQVIFYFGFICYLILLPLALYRVFVIKSIKDPAIPTITTFAAPGSLCLAGYMSSFLDKNISMVCFLTFMSLVSLLGVLIYMPRMLKLKFYPSYAAFTFPLVISGIGIKKVYGYILKSSITIPILKYVVKFEELISILIVLYVLVKYIEFLIKDPITVQTVHSGS